MDLHAWLVLGVFVLVLGLIISEKVNRTVASLLGASIVVLIHTMTETSALHYIDFNTLGVLIGMMIMVGIIRETGIFEYMAIIAAKKSKGDPWKIIISLCIITASTSALLDNVTTILLIVPMTLTITSTLDLDPIPFILPEVLASNIGGTATLIGDPPNIMIGSAVGLEFIDFLKNLAPIVIIIFIVTFLILKIQYKNKFSVSDEKKAEILEMNEKEYIKNRVLLFKSLLVFSLVLAGFIFHSFFDYATGAVAIIGATLLLLLSKQDIEKAMRNVEWPTIFFFSGLFVIVGALEEVGIISKVASFMINLTGDNLLLTGIIILWFSAIVSAFLDNIPFVATLIPLIKTMGAAGINITPLWWAVSLGACLGGNGTLIGASANVVAAGIAEKHGHTLSFKRFFITGFPLMIVSIILSTIYLVIFYLR